MRQKQLLFAPTKLGREQPLKQAERASRSISRVGDLKRACFMSERHPSFLHLSGGS